VRFRLTDRVVKGGCAPEEVRMAGCIDRARSEFSFLTGLFGSPDLDKVQANIALFRSLFGSYDGPYQEEFRGELRCVEEKSFRIERVYDRGRE